MSMPRNLSQTLLVGSVFLVALATTSGMETCPRIAKASCSLVPNPSLPTSRIRGEILLTQRITCNREYPVEIKVNIAGMVADGNTTLHGFHVHRFGDLSEGCESTKAHYNPYDNNHGAQTDQIWQRHVGCLGNVPKNPRGRVTATIYDSIATLVGEISIIGRGIVLHEMEDDLGRGGDEGSLTTGNAGRRLACCTIESMTDIA